MSENISKLKPQNRFERVREEDLNDKEKNSIIELAKLVLAKRYQPGELLTKPEDSATYLQFILAEEEREVFGVLFLDNSHCVISFETLFFGTIDSASVYPRVVVQRALLLNAQACIVVHNHPSGTMEPSVCDRQITDKLKEALNLLDIRLLDHFIVSTQGTLSFAEHGYI